MLPGSDWPLGAGAPAPTASGTSVQPLLDLPRAGLCQFPGQLAPHHMARSLGHPTHDSTLLLPRPSSNLRVLTVPLPGLRGALSPARPRAPVLEPLACPHRSQHDSGTGGRGIGGWGPPSRMGTMLLVTWALLFFWQIRAQERGDCAAPSSPDLPAPKLRPVGRPPQTLPASGARAGSTRHRLPLKAGNRAPSCHNPVSPCLPRPYRTVTEGRVPLMSFPVPPASPSVLAPGGLRVSGQRGNETVQGLVAQRPEHMMFLAGILPISIVTHL